MIFLYFFWKFTQLNRSDEHNVVLNNVGSSLAGKYRCEVSTDSPTFITKRESGYMYVISKYTSTYISILYNIHRCTPAAIMTRFLDQVRNIVVGTQGIDWKCAKSNWKLFSTEKKTTRIKIHDFWGLQIKIALHK